MVSVVGFFTHEEALFARQSERYAEGPLGAFSRPHT